MIADLYQRIKLDPWREEVGFSPEVERANSAMFDADPAVCKDVLNEWLWTGNNQTCLFGRTAARLGLISYCILTDSDLEGSDQGIADKIQEARLEWTRDGFLGTKNAFIVLAVSRRIAYGVPDPTVRELAQRLGSLYLQDDIQPDQIYTDELFLAMPGQRQTTWRWKAGVNYFCAQGDKRWWQDHRIPGGMAFSVNSVGHMVKSGKLAAGMNYLAKSLGAPEEGWDASKVDSLEQALKLAMLTIDNASNAVSGKATELLPLPTDPQAMPVPACPYQLPNKLADRNFCEYSGHYHTDCTLPSEYFLPAVDRPEELPPHLLDFTYLFHRSVNNPAFVTMGEGQPIRNDDETVDSESSAAKARRFQEEVSNISQNPRLAAALSL